MEGSGRAKSNERGLIVQNKNGHLQCIYEKEENKKRPEPEPASGERDTRRQKGPRET
jgi:hypothetical protein